MTMIPDDAIRTLERPHSSLLTYYVLGSLLLGPFFVFALVPLYFRYHTMRYRFDDDGISMRWGILFRREVHLTYSRIQDIHLVSNVVERWLGLARIQIQTASGSSKAEMTIEGLREFEALRDFIYARMRGSRRTGRPSGAPAGALASPPPEPAPGTAELASLLREAAAELRGIRERLDRGGGRHV
jgi:putative membrane protein